jgi:hypothetical protein
MNQKQLQELEDRCIKVTDDKMRQLEIIDFKILREDDRYLVYARDYFGEQYYYVLQWYPESEMMTHLRISKTTSIMKYNWSVS